METKTINYFTTEERAFVKILVETGLKKSVATVLVFLAKVPQATSRDIERGTDQRQPEVSQAMQHLDGKGWVLYRQAYNLGGGKGRPMRVYRLAKPIAAIIDEIEREQTQKVERTLARLHKIDAIELGDPTPTKQTSNTKQKTLNIEHDV